MHPSIIRVRATIAHWETGNSVARLTFVVRVTDGPTNVSAKNTDWWHDTSNTTLSPQLDGPTNLLPREQDQFLAERALLQWQFPREQN
jgi:hypothetical protein